MAIEVIIAIGIYIIAMCLGLSLYTVCKTAIAAVEALKDININIYSKAEENTTDEKGQEEKQAKLDKYYEEQQQGIIDIAENLQNIFVGDTEANEK